MTSDLLLPGWGEKIATAIGTAPALPLCPPCRGTTSPAASTWSGTAPGPTRWSQAAFESPVSCIGIDTEYRFPRINRSGCARARTLA